MGNFPSILPIAGRVLSIVPKIPPPDSLYRHQHDVIIRILCIIRCFTSIFKRKGDKWNVPSHPE